MSPLGQKISDWIRSKPGMFRANTEQGAYALAYAAAVATNRMKEVTTGEFCGALHRLGYIPTQRMNHGDRSTFWVLSLPENS